MILRGKPFSRMVDISSFAIKVLLLHLLLEDSINLGMVSIYLARIPIHHVSKCALIIFFLENLLLLLLFGR